jgi:NADH dehydrogenase
MPDTTPHAEPRKKRVIVIGAGFAGINAVKRLNSKHLQVILVDKHNYHLFQPLLYQVATAALSPADIAYPIRRIFRTQKNVDVALGKVEKIDLAHNMVCGGEACVMFDYLVVAVGCTHSYFGKDAEWHGIAPGLKTIDDATELRRRILLAFEEAELEEDVASRKAKLTFVVVGGGPTGVEMAGAMREIAAKDIQKDFRHIDTSTTQVILLQGGDRLIPGFDPKLSARAKKDLESLGVEVRLDAKVTDVTDAGVVINGTEHLPAQNVIWAAGVRAPLVLSTMGVPQDRAGRVKVNPDLSVPGHPNVFVVGDAAEVIDAKTGKPVPGLAPAAMQMGKFVAKIIKNEVEKGVPVAQRPPFKYWDKGTMATIGTRRAVADIKGIKFAGLLAWLAWSGIHVMFLIGFRTKIFVVMGWIYDYFFKGREARLITGNFRLKVTRPIGVTPRIDTPAAATAPPAAGAATVAV